MSAARVTTGTCYACGRYGIMRRVTGFWVLLCHPECPNTENELDPFDEGGDAQERPTTARTGAAPGNGDSA